MGNQAPITPQIIFNVIREEETSEPFMVPFEDDRSKEIYDHFMKTKTNSTEREMEVDLTKGMNYCCIGYHKCKEIAAFYFNFGKTLYMLMEHDNPYFKTSLAALKEAKKKRFLLYDNASLKMTVMVNHDIYSEYVWVKNVTFHSKQQENNSCNQSLECTMENSYTLQELSVSS